MAYQSFELDTWSTTPRPFETWSARCLNVWRPELVTEDFKDIGHYFKGLTPLCAATMKNDYQEVAKLLCTTNEQFIKTIVDKHTLAWISGDDKHDHNHWWELDMANIEFYPGYYDMNPLTISAKWGYTDITNILLIFGANINWVSAKTGSSALHLACSNDQYEVVKLLINYKADVNIKNVDGMTPLHLARTVDVARMLLNAGADINAYSDFGTPLEYIIDHPTRPAKDLYSLVELYLNSKNDYNIFSQQALIYKEFNYNKEIIKLIKSKLEAALTKNVNDKILNGRYPNELIIGQWGDYHNVPHKCYVPIESSDGAPCQTLPTWYCDGVWTCKNHKSSTIKETRYVLPSPAPPSTAPQFESFECSVCLMSCNSSKKAYTYPQCNHRFHKACVANWAKEKEGALTCPLCRDTVVSHPFYKEQWFGEQTRDPYRYNTIDVSSSIYKIIYQHKVTPVEFDFIMDLVRTVADNFDDESILIKIKKDIDEFPTNNRRVDFNRRMIQFQTEMLNALAEK